MVTNYSWVLVLGFLFFFSLLSFFYLWLCNLIFEFLTCFLFSFNFPLKKFFSHIFVSFIFYFVSIGFIDFEPKTRKSYFLNILDWSLFLFKSWWHLIEVSFPIKIILSCWETTPPHESKKKFKSLHDIHPHGNHCLWERVGFNFNFSYVCNKPRR